VAKNQILVTQYKLMIWWSFVLQTLASDCTERMNREIGCLNKTRDRLCVFVIEFVGTFGAN